MKNISFLLTILNKKVSEDFKKFTFGFILFQLGEYMSKHVIHIVLFYLKM